MTGPRYHTKSQVQWSRALFWKTLLSGLKTKSLVWRKLVAGRFAIRLKFNGDDTSLYTQCFFVASIIALYVVQANFVKNIRSNSQGFTSYLHMVQCFSLGFLVLAWRSETLLLLACLWALAWAGVDFGSSQAMGSILSHAWVLSFLIVTHRQKSIWNRTIHSFYNHTQNLLIPT